MSARITHALRNLFHQPAQICLATLQGTLWWVVVPSPGGVLNEKNRTSPICALVVAFVIWALGHDALPPLTDPGAGLIVLEVLLG
eukprot:CAMPEP_0115722596 /NCGR_PEP_ID=MMETSP0272-20121206/79768_1 /TAXON_ID=71861 /ORGANISM="Scrippsiella trochoidea, Strain CCMP3099" /LENGTH=84 /DNA_ID=CAMNT_0003165641 /DNA_START=41 /DNA_END=291 /DNA_ORIENTATION=+